MSSQKIRIKLKAYDHKILDESAKLIVDALARDDASFSGPIPLPTEKEVVTILRSPHVNKDSREQFGCRQIRILSAMQFFQQFVLLNTRQEIQFTGPIPFFLAHIPGNFKNHRTGDTILCKLQFAGAFAMELTIMENGRMTIATDTLQSGTATPG